LLAFSLQSSKASRNGALTRILVVAIQMRSG
jgi:hypothetical protein